MNEFLQKLLGNAPADEVPLLQAAARVLVSGLLGGVVAALHLWSCRSRSRAEGMAPMLVLLAMLITMVTLAVADNAARAFTLVGTLAIVRFRTTVRDLRDTVFVIFAVAVGMAVGALHLKVAVGGTLAAGVAIGILFFRRSEPALLRVEPARLSLRVAGTAGDGAAYSAALERWCTSARVLLVQSRDGGQTTELVYDVTLEEPRSATALVDALRTLPGVTKVALSFAPAGTDESP